MAIMGRQASVRHDGRTHMHPPRELFLHSRRREGDRRGTDIAEIETQNAPVLAHRIRRLPTQLSLGLPRDYVG